MFVHIRSQGLGRRLAIATTVTASSLALLPAAASACANADVEPVTPEQIAAAAKATHCLVNQERRARGLRGLRWNKRLQRAGEWQANDMLAFGYFDHGRVDGPEFSRRLRRYGYARSARGYTLGENIAFGTAPDATPREMVDAWMASPGHRENILRRAFREDGIGIVRSEGETEGDYAGYGPVLIYVHDFGKRY